MNYKLAGGLKKNRKAIIVGLVFFGIMWRYCENKENFETILIALSILAVIAEIFAGIFVFYRV